MLSLLIVDDEVIIADGLYQMLQEAFQDQLVVRRCYSASQAQRMMEDIRIDVLMTDIEMPDGSGLELHQWVRSRWPLVRVIYLTGYSDFDYARRALNQNALAYVLKSEGDPVIIETVQRAIQAIKEEEASLVQMVKEEHRHAGRIHQLIYHAMHGGSVSLEQFQIALAEQEVPLSASSPVMVGYCYSEEPDFHLAQAMGLVERLMGQFFPLLMTGMTSRAFLLICQSSWPECRQLLCGMIENAQAILEKHNGLMTVCLMDAPVPWDQLSEAGESLLEQLSRRNPVPGELLLIPHDASAPSAQMPDFGEEWFGMMDSLHRLNELLMTGQRDLYFEEEKSLFSRVAWQQSGRQANTVADTMAASLLHCAETLPLSDRLNEEMDHVRGICSLQDMSQAPERLHRLAELLFDVRGLHQSRRQRQLISSVNDYIASHMDGDLSLITIADAVHFHPVYLSRIYKEYAGVSLSDYIANQRLSTACQLLRTTQTQISSIAKSTGFTSSNYFSRWFRKRIGLTPQEYRDKENPS